MKTIFFANIVSVTAVAASCLLAACFPQTASAQTDSAFAPTPDGATTSAAPDTSTALPPNVYPFSPLAQVIKLTQAGVSADVIMAFVTNSGSTFNLDPDKIIYMKDIGAPDDLVTAMMQRDQVLQAQMAASTYQPPAPQPPSQPAPADNPTVVDAAPPPPTTDVTVNDFYNTLAPYGSWVNIGGYGLCWRPTVIISIPTWQPYCDHGHWVYTDCGWYWISDYSWGWATFHYGRWFHNPRYGWCWAPGTVWGPSWVTWRYSSDYCGWAPLPPGAVYQAGIGFFYNGVSVSVGFDFGLGASAFIFVPTKNFCDPHPRRYCVPRAQVTQIYNHTTVINNFTVDSQKRTFINHGIAPDRITAITRTEIHPVAIRETTAPIARGEQLGRDGRTLLVNRPDFAANQRPSERESFPRAAAPPPAMGSPYQPTHNGNENNNAQPPVHYQPAPPAPAPGQRQMPPAATFGSPARNETPAPVEPSPPPVNRYAPVQPSGPNYNSTDNRRYPSPRMQQRDQQNAGANPGNSGARAVAPVTPPAPPVEQSPPNHSQPPAAGNQSHGASAPSSAPAQSQHSGGSRYQNGQ